YGPRSCVPRGRGRASSRGGPGPRRGSASRRTPSDDASAGAPERTRPLRSDLRLRDVAPGDVHPCVDVRGSSEVLDQAGPLDPPPLPDAVGPQVFFLVEGHAERIHPPLDLETGERLIDIRGAV